MARRLSAALAVVLLTAACGNRERGETTAPTSAPDGAPSGSVTTSSTGGGATGPNATQPRPGATARPSSGGRPPSGSSSTKAAIDDAAASPVGRFAGAVLAPGIVSSLVLDVRVGGGAQVRPEAVDAMAAALRSASGKPVTVSGPTPLSGAQRTTHSAAEIRQLADSQGTANRDGVAVLHVLYLPGAFERPDALGVAVRGDTVALFPDTIDGATSPLVAGSRLERAVATHELGHLLGLVDIYLNRDRDDPEHPGHSRNRGSVMFWAVETSLVGQVLGGPPPVDFDAEDLADLRRIRSGAASDY